MVAAGVPGVEKKWRCQSPQAGPNFNHSVILCGMNCPHDGLNDTQVNQEILTKPLTRLMRSHALVLSLTLTFL